MVARAVAIVLLYRKRLELEQRQRAVDKRLADLLRLITGEQP